MLDKKVAAESMNRVSSIRYFKEFSLNRKIPKGKHGNFVPKPISLDNAGK